MIFGDSRIHIHGGDPASLLPLVKWKTINFHSLWLNLFVFWDTISQSIRQKCRAETFSNLITVETRKREMTREYSSILHHARTDRWFNVGGKY